MAIALILCCVIWGVGPGPQPAGAAASSADVSTTPVPCTSAADRSDFGAWCLHSIDDVALGAIRPTLGTYVAHLNPRTDTTVTIPIPEGGYSPVVPTNPTLTLYGRDPATNNRVSTGGSTPATIGSSAVAGTNPCDYYAPTCTITFKHTDYPTGGHDPAWVFAFMGYSSTNHFTTLGRGEFAIKLVYDDRGSVPSAAFETHPAGAGPGSHQFVSSSTDPSGGALTQTWAFGDGTTGTGVAINHTYSAPGTFPVTLTVTNAAGLSDSVTHDVVVTAPTLAASLVFVDAAGHMLPSVSPQLGDVVSVRLTVSAADDGVGAVHGIAFTGDPLSVTPSGLATVTGPVPAIPTALQLSPGTSASYVYALKSTAAGVVHMSTALHGTDASGAAVAGGSAQLSYGIGGLKVELALDPANYTEDEDADGPKPVLVTVTEKITNISDDTLSGVNVRSIDPSRVTSGQLLKVSRTGGVQPDPVSGYPLAVSLAPGASTTVTSTFTVSDDGRIRFSSLVTASSSSGATLRGLGTALLTARPKYFFAFTSRVIRPAEGTLLPAGDPITITGTVHNLTDTDTVDVGPLYGALDGNAGVQGLAYDGTGVDPRRLLATGGLRLEPGETRTFTLKVLTAYSQPDGDGGVLPSGGKTARVTFTPWAKVTEDDGTTFTTSADGLQVLADDTQLVHVVHIDDSVPMPVHNPAAVAAGVLYGGVEGVWNAASGFATGIVKLPYTLGSAVGYGLIAAEQYEARVWGTFTEAQKRHFSEHVGDLAVAYLEANVGTAAEGVGVLHERVAQFTHDYFAKIRYQWNYGDYAGAAKTYSSLITNAFAQVVIPAAWGELAKSGEAVTALDEAQAALQTKVVALTEAADSATTVERIVPLLTQIASGTAIDANLATKLYGITAEELAELQKLAEKYQILLTVRSRSTTSIDWLEHFQALVKPEALKIKSVSALDIRLGYPTRLKGYRNAASSEGALVFKEPTPLIQARNGEGVLEELVPAFVREKGFTPGTAEFDDAVARVNERIAEWNEWAPSYQKWSKRGWIDVGFNWKGNAMADPTRSGSGKFAGFRLKPNGPEGEYIVEMYNFKAKRFVPVTGDIDPIAFTRLDGSPLTPTQHAALVNDLRRNPVLQTQHGESATYVKGGLAFIQKQFKPGEAALQLGPSRVARAVRFDAQQSSWTSATDYRLVWDQGVISAGGTPVVDAVLESPWADLIKLPRPPPPGITLPLPGNGDKEGNNVGRCSMTYSTSASAPALIMGASGALDQLSAKGTTVSPLESVCFGEGPVVNASIRPVTAVGASVPAGAREVPIASGPGVAAADAAGVGNGFQVGQQVMIGAGTPDAELATISGFGSLILTAGLRHAHRAGEVIVVVRPASGHVVPVAPPGSPSGSGSRIASTGAPIVPLLPIGVLLVVSGAAAAVGGRRRRRPVDGGSSVV